jgi:hypothetical protein
MRIVKAKPNRCFKVAAKYKKPKWINHITYELAGCKIYAFWWWNIII